MRVANLSSARRIEWGEGGEVRGRQSSTMQRCGCCCGWFRSEAFERDDICSIVAR